MTQVASLSIVALTVGLSLARPRLGRLRIHHGLAGAIGALLTLVLGLGPPNTLLVAAQWLAEPVATIVALMVITQVADESGLFDRLALFLARAARGSGPRLFGALFLVGSAVGMVFTNDAAVLIFTPIVFRLVEQIGRGKWSAENKLAYYFAVLYVANLVGALVIANPINLVVAKLLKIEFVEFALWMALPAAASVAVSYAGLWLYFRKSIPSSFTLPESAFAPRGDTRMEAACAAIVGLTLVGFFSEPLTGLPPWLTASVGAVAAIALYALRRGGQVAPLARGVSWDAIVFLCGMFIVGLGVRNAGVTERLADWIEWASAGNELAMRATVGLVAAACSALINNHPTADIMAFTIQELSLPESQRKLLGLAALIGGDLGPKMLPIGSLAALIWFGLLRDRGVEIPYSLYIKLGVPITLAALACSLAVLSLQGFLLAA